MKDQFKNSDVYDIQSAEPITKILERHFLNIEFAYKFQEATVNEKRGLLQDIALEIDSLNTPSIEMTDIPGYKETQEALDKLTIIKN
jgi:hypothetical protein